jgi:hypothetical protein
VDAAANKNDEIKLTPLKSRSLIVISLENKGITMYQQSTLAIGLCPIGISAVP